MNFTREPIIETIISPRDGFKLLVRNSKGGGSEEYFVDALEVVSFGHAFFFRSLERPKSFLAPVSDYEVLEVKETRVALKNVSHERSIKIGGGRETPPPRQQQREPVAEKETEEAEVSATEETVHAEAPAEGHQRMDKRRDRRRHRRRRPSDEQEWSERKSTQSESSTDTETSRQGSAVEGGGANEETKVSSSMFTHLLPPPLTLISETISRYKGKEFSIGAPGQKQSEEVAPESPQGDEPSAQEPKSEPAPQPRKEDDSDSAESTPLHRVIVDSAQVESSSFSSTHFSPLGGNFGFDPYL